MYKVLWVCSVPPKEVAMDIGLPISSGGGWMQGLLEEFCKIDHVKLAMCFPLNNCRKSISGHVNNIDYYAFYQKANIAGISDNVSFEKKTESDLKEILAHFKPDILHIFGTENSYALMVFRIFDRPERTLVHIQGLTSVIADYYDGGLSFAVAHMFVPSSVLRGTIYKQKQTMSKRGINEISLLKKAKYVTGRTDWDKAHCLDINKNIKYFYCGEMLRDSFYQSTKWNPQSCKKHTVFLSQGSYPLKGLHIVIEALSRIKQSYPDVILNVAGSSPVKDNSLKGIAAISSYGVYIKRLIRKYALSDNVHFLGTLTEKEMVHSLLEANTYVLSSFIENSPNSLGEAMLIGVPCVAADVGGVASMMRHGIDGYIYQHNDPVMLSYYIEKTFEDTEERDGMCKCGVKMALENHSKGNIFHDLSHIYEEILHV